MDALERKEKVERKKALDKQKKERARKERIKNRGLTKKKKIIKNKKKKTKIIKKVKHDLVIQPVERKKRQKQEQSSSVKRMIRQSKSDIKAMKELKITTDKDILKLLGMKKNSIRYIKTKNDIDRLKSLLRHSPEIKKNSPMSNSLVASGLGGTKQAIIHTNNKGDLNGVLVFKPSGKKSIKITDLYAKGSGKVLMNRLIKDNKCKLLILHSLPDVVTFYEKFGFVPDGEEINNLTPMIRR